jgi:hypothetical protein
MDPQAHSPPNGRDENDVLTAVEWEHLANPLCVVRGYTQLLQRRLRRGDAVEQHDLLRVLGLIEAASCSVTTSISALVAKCDSGREASISK